MSEDLKHETATIADAPRKAQWQTPTLEVVDIALETEVGVGPVNDGSGQS